MATKFKRAYYSVHALQDGTILFAFQTRKPVKSITGGKPQIDEDAVHSWWLETRNEQPGYTDWAKAAKTSAVANCLNTKRIIRSQVATRLDRIEKQLAEIAEHLRISAPA